jgi:Fe-S-cluster-containing dehydrogenase component
VSKEKISGNQEILGTSMKDWLATPTTRRKFLKIAGVGGLGTIALYLTGCNAAALGLKKQDSVVIRKINVDDALGMVIGVTNRCVGCRRCELACTEYNEGFSQPSLARVNIRRNWAYGPKGAQIGFSNAQGRYGNHRIIQEACRQCAHPTPCALACPYDAIETVPPANARVVNPDKCKGCRTCQRACPWGMTTFNEVTEKATKCFLCNNDPECVKACPSGALRYIPWTDLTKDIPGRFVVSAALQVPDDIACQTADCHPTFGKTTTAVK